MSNFIVSLNAFFVPLYNVLVSLFWFLLFYFFLNFGTSSHFCVISYDLSYSFMMYINDHYATINNFVGKNISNKHSHVINEYITSSKNDPKIRWVVKSTENKS